MTPRIVCAPDSFKGTLSAREASEAMARGVRAAMPGAEIDRCPIGDGGEGTLDALINSVGGIIPRHSVTGPLGQRLLARYGVSESDGSIVIELAEAAGLTLVPDEHRNPLRTTTFGVGELIVEALKVTVEALKRDPRQIIIGVGGSATVDGGCGLAQACGVVFRDETGSVLKGPITGADLVRIASIETGAVSLPPIRVACDVRNPLLGPDGAATVYGPQKGATAAMVRALEQGLANLAHLLPFDTNTPGCGAAGGAAFGLAAMLGATLRSGIDLVLEAVRFDSRCTGASLVLTGEGSLDAQTTYGKACTGVAKRAKARGVPVIAIVGEHQPAAAHHELFTRVISLSEHYGRDRAMRETAPLIEQAVAAVVAE